MYNLDKDKYIHFGICFIITYLVLILFYFLEAHFITSALAGILAAMGASFGKEYGDMKNPVNKWDWYDIYANIAGTLAGLFVGSFLWI